MIRPMGQAMPRVKEGTVGGGAGGTDTAGLTVGTGRGSLGLLSTRIKCCRKDVQDAVEEDGLILNPSSCRNWTITDISTPDNRYLQIFSLTSGDLRLCIGEAQGK